MLLPRSIAPLALLSATLATASATDWPMHRGPGNNGTTPDASWSLPADPNQFNAAWKASIGIGFSGITVAGNRVFTMGNISGEDVVHCLDAATGQSLWRYAYKAALGDVMYEGGPNSTPTVDGKVVYAASRTGEIHALDLSDGNLLWSVSLSQLTAPSKNGKQSNWGLSGSPVVAGNRLLLNYGLGATVLDKVNGKLLWSMGQGDDASFHSPVLTRVGGVDAVLLMMPKQFIAVRLDDGLELFNHPFGKGYRTHCTDPLVTPAGVFISSGDDGGELLDLSSGQPKRVWKNMNLATFTGTAVLIGAHLYGHDAGGYKKGNQEFRCVDLATGKVNWGFPGFGQGSVIAARDRLVVLSEQGEVAVFKANPAQAELLFRAQALGGKTWTEPTLAHGRLYCRNAKGDLVCFQL